MIFVRFTIMAVAFAVLTLSAQETVAGTVKVFLLGGQSNADGRALSSELPTDLQQPQSDVDFFFRVEGYHPWENQLIDLKPGSPEFNQTNYFGPEITFGRDMADYYSDTSDTSAAIIKYANGSTRLYDHWLAPGGSEYTNFQSTVAAGISALQAAHPDETIEIAGMIWMQGENDTTEDLYANSYQTNLESFISDVRTRYGTNLPFVIGRLSTNQTSLDPTRLQVVMDAQTAVASNNSCTGLVDTNSFTIAGDNVHFDAVGQQSLGSAFASSMQTIMNLEPTAPAPQLPTISGTVAHYSFDTNYNDSSGNYNHGIAFDGNGDGDTAGVSITSTAGEHVFGGGAANFTAERDYINIANQVSYANNEDYSISFWARDLSDSSSGGMAIGTHGVVSDFIWLWHDGSFIRWRGAAVLENFQNDFPIVPDNEWHHYAIVADNHSGDIGDITLYMDGTLIDTATNKYTAFDVDSIGSAYITSSDFDWQGQLDEVWIFNRALDADEVCLLYDSNGQAIPGDTNVDGKVDETDAAILAANWLTTGCANWRMGDFNGDGDVNEIDATIMAANWGMTAPAVGSAPEPSTLLSLLVAIPALLFMKRKI